MDDMRYLVLADFTQKSVANSRMLQRGGGVALGRYTRRAKNIVTSPVLRARMNWTATNMREECGLVDKCLPRGFDRRAIGQPVPGKFGKTYVDCTDEQRTTRLNNARECAIRTLATKGGIYGRAA